MSTFETAIEHLCNSASKAKDSGDAMRFAQAATNVANAAMTMAIIKREQDEATVGGAGE